MPDHVSRKPVPGSVQLQIGDVDAELVIYGVDFPIDINEDWVTLLSIGNLYTLCAIEGTFEYLEHTLYGQDTYFKIGSPINDGGCPIFGCHRDGHVGK